jgi:hypothetical protein
MAHGPETDDLLALIANMKDGRLTLGNSSITSLPALPPGIRSLVCHTLPNLASLPDLPHGLQVLYCMDMPLTRLPALPSTLKMLYCNTLPLSSLPDLPPNLKNLNCERLPLSSLPELPLGLEHLDCSNTQITTLPYLPHTLKTLFWHNTPLILQRAEGESTAEYLVRLKEEQASKKRCAERSRAIHEELAAAVWHPSRVESWMTAGGVEMLEAL